MLVSRLKVSALMDRVAVERTRRERPAGGHSRPRAGQSRFLLRGQAAGGALDRDDARDGRAIARNRERRTPFDVADDARKRLVGLAQGQRSFSGRFAHEASCSTEACYMKGMPAVVIDKPECPWRAVILPGQVRRRLE